MIVFILGWRPRFNAPSPSHPADKPSFLTSTSYTEFRKTVDNYMSAPGGFRYDYRIVTIEVEGDLTEDELRAQIEPTTELWLPTALDSTLIPHVHEPDWSGARVLGDADETPRSGGILEVGCKHCDLRGATTVPDEVISW